MQDHLDLRARREQRLPEVRNLRARAGQLPDDPAIRETVGELCPRSPVFATMWAYQEVRPRGSEEKRFRHPSIGWLDLRYQAFTVEGALGQRLSVYTATPGSPAADGLTLLRSIADRPEEPVDRERADR
jgi:hypothetical protein